MTQPKSDDEIREFLKSIYYRGKDKQVYSDAELDADLAVFNTEKKKWAGYVVGECEPFTGNGGKIPEARNGLRSEQLRRNV